jgi:hypothetical protein
MSNYSGYATGSAYAITSASASSTGAGEIDRLYNGEIGPLWRTNTSGTTHWIRLELPRAVWLSGFRVWPIPTDLTAWDSCTIHVSTQPLAYGDDWGAPAFSGDLSPTGANQWNDATFPEAWGRYVLITATVTAGQALRARGVDLYILSIVAAVDDDLPTDDLLLGGAARWWINIGDSAGNVYGDGPIVSARYWQSTARVDRAGEFSFSMPLADIRADLITERRYAYCYALTTEGVQLVGSGIIDQIEQRPDADGNIDLVVSGSDLLRELVWRTTGFLALAGDDAPITHAEAAAALEALAPAGWTFHPDDYPANNEIYYYFAGESLLAGVILLSELTRSHVWLRSGRDLWFSNEWDDLGLRAIEAGEEASLTDDNVCLISDLAITATTHDLISRIIPVGAELRDAPGTYVDLTTCNRVAPTGYTLDTTGNYIKNDDSEFDYGRVEYFAKYSNIEAASSSGWDLQAAANQLYEAALYELQQRSQPVTEYQISLAHAPRIIQPFGLIRVVFRRVVGGRTVLDVDDTLYVLGATTTVDADGLRTTALEASTVDRWAQSDLDPLRRSARNSLRIR